MKLPVVSGFLLFCLSSVAVFAYAQERPEITGIAFVRMYSADLKASDAFDGKTLGYRAVDDKGVVRYGVNPSQWMEVEALPQGAPATRMPIVGLTTRDVPAMERYLAAHQVAVAGRVAGGGFVVKDPEGNLIGFMQSGAMKGKLEMSANASSGREDGFYRKLLGFHTYWQGGQKGTSADCSKTQMGRDGKVQLNLFDPALTRVEFMEFKPSGTVCCTAVMGKHPGPEENQ
jgi:hypothetical protein